MSLKILKKSQEAIKKQLRNLDIKTVESLAKNHSKAVEYIKIGREAVEGTKLSEDQAESLANELQSIAEMELSLRSKD